MPVNNKSKIFNLCLMLQKQIKLGKENNLDEEDLLKLKQGYNYYFNMLKEKE